MTALDRYKKQAVLLGDPGSEEIQELMNFQQSQWKPRLAELMVKQDPMAAGSLYYQDSRPPYYTASFAAVTLTTTAKQLWTSAEATPTYKNDWTPGKIFWIRAFGVMTTAATPGNLTASIAYGTADNTGVMSSTAALTLIANQTNASWRGECYIQCRGVGASGSLMATGVLEFAPGVIAAAQGLIPASAPTAATVDLTATSALNLQFARSGSTVETATTVSMVFGAMN